MENVGASFIFFLFYHVKGKLACLRRVLALVGPHELYYLTSVVLYDDPNPFYVEIHLYGQPAQLIALDGKLIFFYFKVLTVFRPP